MVQVAFSTALSCIAVGGVVQRIRLVESPPRGVTSTQQLTMLLVLKWQRGCRFNWLSNGWSLRPMNLLVVVDPAQPQLDALAR